MINRIINKSILTTQKSVLLLGPRQVGKSTIMNQLNTDIQINLTDELEYLNYSTDPERLQNLIFVEQVRLNQIS